MSPVTTADASKWPHCQTPSASTLPQIQNLKQSLGQRGRRGGAVAVGAGRAASPRGCEKGHRRWDAVLRAVAREGSGDRGWSSRGLL